MCVCVCVCVRVCGRAPWSALTDAYKMKCWHVALLLMMVRRMSVLGAVLNKGPDNCGRVLRSLLMTRTIFGRLP